MAELVDALDLKSRGPQGPCGFESRWGHTEDENLRKQTATLSKPQTFNLKMLRKNVSCKLPR